MDSIRVTVCGRTDRGRSRRDNQDGFLILDLQRPGTAVSPEQDGGHSGEDGGHSGEELSFDLGARGAVLLVADGMGGRAGGARASGLAISAVRDVMLSGHPHVERGDGSAPARTRGDGSGPGEASGAGFARKLGRALEVANDAIHEGSREGPHAGMGSTATLAGLLGDRVYVAQVGDSRAYLIRARHVGRLTRDQSLVQDLIDSGILDEDDTQGVGRNMILQALGPTPTVQPAVTYHELRRGDVLLLCSDGLSGVVRDDEIQSVVSEAADCASLCDALVDLANDRGGPDNITVVAARIEGGGVSEPGDSEGVVRRAFGGPGG